MDEAKVAALMVRDNEFLAYCSRNQLDTSEFFRDPIVQYLADNILELGGRYNTVSFDMLVEHLLGKKHKQPSIIKDNRESLVETIEDLFEAEYTDLEFVKDNISKQMRIQAYDAALQQCADYLEDSDADAIDDLLESTMRRVKPIEIKIHRLEDDLGGALMERLNAMKSGAYQGIPTGIPMVDNNLLWKGLGFEELALVLGPPKRGKTMFMLWLTFWALLSGYNVLYVTLEVSRFILEMRLIQCYMHLYVDELIDHHEMAINRFRGWLNKRKRKAPKRGKLSIVDLPPKAIRAADLHYIVKDEKSRGKIPHLFVVDMPKLLRHRQDGWEGISESTEETRGICKAEGVAGVAGAQGNKGSVKKDRLDHDDTAFDFSQVGTMDTMFALGKRPDDQEFGEDSEDGTSRILPCPMDLIMPAGRNNPSLVTKVLTDYGRGRFFLEQLSRDGSSICAS